MSETPTVQDSGVQAPPEATAPKQETSPVMTEETVRKLIQSETDKVRTKYSQELAEKKAEIETLQKEKMSAAERKKFEEDQLRDQLTKKAAELTLKEQNLLAVDLLKEKGIPDRLRSFVVGNDEATTRANVEKLHAEFQAAVKEAVEGRFKELGKSPEKPSGDPKTTTIYTRAQIAEMSKKAQDHSTPPADRAAINKEMQAAMQEGRIRG